MTLLNNSRWMQRIAGILKKVGQGRSEPPLSLYLHIGLPKTGTTAIQHFLHHNRETLMREQKILYPECGIPVFQHAALVKSIVQPLFPWAHFNEMIETVTPRDYLQEIISRCGAAGCNRVIVSSEFFWSAPAMQSEIEHHKPTAENFSFLNRFVEQCRTLFSVFGRVEVVVYLRKQESWFDSFFNQQIKDGFSIPDTHELAAPKNYLLYYRNLEMWAKHFGQDNIIVRLYEEVKTDVVEDFCLITGIDMSKGVTRPPENTETVNPRLSPTALRIMQRALQLQLDPTVVDLLKHTLRQTSSVFAGKGRRSPIFPDSFYIDVSECYRKDNLKLSEIFPEAIIYLEQGSRTEHDTMVIPGQPEAPDNTIEQLLDHLLLILMNHKED